MVPARELSMEELVQMRKDTSLEMEVFVHGALCYCYSGQCLFSSMLGGRSGNREDVPSLADSSILLTAKSVALVSMC